MGLKRACGAFLSPLRWSAERRTTTPVPSSKEGDYGGRNEIFSNLRLARCKAADPWLWLAGLSVCRKREGVPLPRSGGGREGADASAIPYKHRLAHDPGRRSRSGRAFRCVGSLGRSPEPFLHPFVGTKGCPRRVGVQIRTFYKSCVAVRREETMIKRLRGGWGAGLRFAEEEPAAGVTGPSHSSARWSVSHFSWVGPAPVR